MYRKYPALYELDSSWNGFEWINADDGDRSIFSFMRRDRSGKNALLFVINFTPMERSDYMVGAPQSGRYTLILDRDGAIAADSDKKTAYTAKKGECDGKPYHIEYPLPPYGCAVFRFNIKQEKKPAAKKTSAKKTK